MENMKTRTAARMPLALSVGAASQMILPPLLSQLVLADIDAHALDTAYAYGDMVRYGANFYWCVGAGDSAAVTGSEPDHDDGDAIDGGVTWRKMHWWRSVVTLFNASDEGTISIARGADAVDESGIVLTAHGVHNEGYGGGPEPYAGAWYAISDAGGPRVLAISEG